MADTNIPGINDLSKVPSASSMDEYESELKRLIATEHRAYLNRIQPYVDELTRLAALRPPPPVMITPDMLRGDDLERLKNIIFPEDWTPYQPIEPSPLPPEGSDV